MAVLRQRIYRKNLNGTYDTIHFETSASAVLMSNGTTVESAVNNKADATHSHSAAQVGAAAANHTHTAVQVGALASNGTAVAATKLATARNMQVNLASTNAAAFNGTANITPGVTGILPVANGGTGVSDLSALQSSLGGGSWTYIKDDSVSVGKNTELPKIVDLDPEAKFITFENVYIRAYRIMDSGTWVGDKDLYVSVSPSVIPILNIDPNFFTFRGFGGEPGGYSMTLGYVVANISFTDTKQLVIKSWSGLIRPCSGLASDNGSQTSEENSELKQMTLSYQLWK